MALVQLDAPPARKPPWLRVKLPAGETFFALKRLVREHRLPFKAAHTIASRLLKAYHDHPGTPLGATLATVSGDLLGVPLRYTDAQIADIMSPRHFVDVRKTIGGPAPTETARAVAQSRATLADDRAWLTGAADRLAAAQALLRTSAQRL